METADKININRLLKWLPYLMFFAGSYIYFGFFGNYVFFYQEKSSLFIFSHDFLIENLHQPGGILIYLAKFLSTFFYYTLAGALIIASVITLIIFSISKIILLLTSKNARVLPFVIGVALFYLQTDYRFSFFNNFGLLLQLVIFSLAIRYLNFLKGWIPILLAPFWYFVTGGFSLIFSLLLTFYFAFDKEKKGWIRIIALWCLNLATFYISKEFLFFQTGKTLLTFPFSDLNTGSQQILFISIAGILSILPIISRIKFRLPDKLRISDFIVSLITTIVLVIILVIIGMKRFDIKTKQYFYVEKLFYQNKFDDLIAYNTSNPPTNSLTIFLNNIALCETDKLNDLLFHFPQSPDGKTLFLKWEMAEEILKRGGYFYYTIGMINEAHRWAFENMVMKGHSPEGLKMLIKTEIINGNYEMASRYISILKKTFFYKEEASAFEKLLFNEPSINADKDIGDKRRSMLKTDFFSITDDPYINIEKILISDSLNKKAYNYKLAFLLLKKDYEGIKKELPKLSGLGFTRFPVNIEEAAIAISMGNNGRMPYSGNIQLSNNTLTRWDQYLRVLQQYKNDPRMAEPALRSQFGNTFWYYAFYRYRN